MIDSHKIYNKTGTGIGLYQSQKFAKKLGFSHHQGIQVKSEWQKGSQFSFILENKEINPGKSKGLKSLESSSKKPLANRLEQYHSIEQEEASQCIPDERKHVQIVP